MRLTLSLRLTTLLILFGSVAVFLTALTTFAIRPTDVSALRILAGDVPYRDFWTMYAPGAFVTLALAFAVTGPYLIVSNLLGILVSATAVATLHHVAAPVAGRAGALAAVAVVVLTFLGTPYFSGLTSYPPALLLILLGAAAMAGRCTAPGHRWAVGPGLLFGAAALYKHDVAAYAALSGGVAILATRWSLRATSTWPPVIVFGLAAASVPAAATTVLIALGAGPDAFDNLIRFPLFDFRYTRGEYFPLIPRLSGSRTDMVLQLRHWAICNLPTAGVGIGLWGLWRGWPDVGARARCLAAFAIAAFCFHWSSAHVQINTNAMSLAAWGTLVAGIGLRHAGQARGLRRVAVAGLAAWALLLAAAPLDEWRTPTPPRTAAVDVPALWGLRVTPVAADRWRDLADAIAAAGPPEAPLLFVSSRNDVVVYTQPTPFWLSPRRSATRHHELHPGVTDIADVQRRMIADIESGSRPVVVREHRFEDETIDRQKARLQTGQPLPRGAELLDDWIARHFDPGPRYGMYEVMVPKPGTDWPTGTPVR